MPPETRYVANGTVNIAYQVVGNGPPDLIFVPGFVSNVEVTWEEPHFARFLEQLASFSRLVLFDKRGTGLSDRVAEMPSLEVRMDDVRAVMDAIGSEHAALFGISEGAGMCVLFAATYPQRTDAVIMAGGYARRAWAPDHPWGKTEDEYRRWIERIQREWGGPIEIELRAKSLHRDPIFRQWWGRYMRMGASPADVVRIVRLTAEIDVRHVLPAIRVPTLILHATGDPTVDARHNRPRKDIGGAAGRKWHDHSHRSFGIWLGRRDARHRRERDSACCDMQELATGKFHGLPSLECRAPNIGIIR
jgi:pimeloyl-ACP methyl ester carboxylesterase